MTIERSSPLAAIQPSGGLPYWHEPRSRQSFDAEFLRPLACQSRSFNFKDLSMKQQTKAQRSNDYFSRPLRGSSPSASLAADLSQNCHIDQSPKVDTPRRSLFVSLGHHIGGQEIITPPIPSSPCLDSDPMEMSPLPHKVPVAASRALDLGLPTPAPTPVLDAVDEPIPLGLDQQHAAINQAVLLPVPGQRRISNAARPSLFRKGYSMSAAAPTSVPTLEQPFVFGSTFFGAAVKPGLESFAESPPSERKLPSSASTSSLLGASCTSSVSGSPVAVTRRPPTARGPRPNGFQRRTQSMQYTNPVKPMREGKRSCTTGLMSNSPIIDIDYTHKPKLPHFKGDDVKENFPRISPETLINLQNGVYASDISEFVIIDCRFEYEYEGGHIQGAVNFNDKDKLYNYLFDSAPQSCARKALILHCEYSNFRAPQAANHIKERDRAYNVESYPNLTYPEMYVLEGGYQAFFKLFRERCFPQNYTQMHSEGNEEACDRGMAKLKHRRKLSRAQTYAFGQHEISALHHPDPRSLSAGAEAPSSPFGSLGFQDMDAMDIDNTSFSTLSSPTTSSQPLAPRRLPSY